MKKNKGTETGEMWGWSVGFWVMVVKDAGLRSFKLRFK